jgi:hypothetical protein
MLPSRRGSRVPLGRTGSGLPYEGHSAVFCHVIFRRSSCGRSKAQIALVVEVTKKEGATCSPSARQFTLFTSPHLHLTLTSLGYQYQCMYRSVCADHKLFLCANCIILAGQIVRIGPSLYIDQRLRSPRMF